MLSVGERRSIHKTIAMKMLSNRTIDVSDIDAILVQALAGRSTICLSKVAYMALVADFREVEQLSEHILFFRFATTDTPIYPGDPSVSVMLRLAQFKLAAATGSGDNVSRVVAALVEEIDAIQDEEAKWILESAALPTVLSTMGIANHLDDWVVRLLRLHTMVEKDKFLQERVSNMEESMMGQANRSLADCSVSEAPILPAWIGLNTSSFNSVNWITRTCTLAYSS